MNRLKKPLLLAFIAAAFIAWFAFDLGNYFTLEQAKAYQYSLQESIVAYPLLSSALFFVIYVVLTALSFPGAAVMTLLGAALFGFWWSLLLVSFASSLGATLAFLASRFLLHDWVQHKFGRRLSAMNRGVEKDGPFYLFTLRLIPVFPFFLVNLLMGLTPMRGRTFYWVSQLGMLPGTMVYLNAGTQLGEIETLSGLISLPVLVSLVLLGIFPFIAKSIMTVIQQRRVYQHWQRPAQFDQNMVVIGAGAGGLVSAYIAAAVKAKVTLIEKHQMGGDCLNTGCVPSKALIRAAHTMHTITRAPAFGIQTETPQLDFSAVLQRVHHVIRQIEPHDSVKRYTTLGVNCIQGEAKIVSPWEVDVNGERITTKNIVIATGARPVVPPIEGIEQVNYLTSDTLWSITEQPKQLLVLGGGPIGCELAQSFQRLGSQVTLAEMADQLLIREDADAAALVLESLTRDGVDIRLKHKAVKFEIRTTSEGESTQFAVLEDTQGRHQDVAFDAVVLALGRVANVTGFGLETLGITVNERRTLEVNEYLQTKYPNIYAVGDVAGPFQLTHAAGHQAWYAAVNGLFGKLKKFKADYRVLPAVTYTSPEVARVGINEKEAADQGIDVDVTCYGIDDLDRAIADGEDYGFIKVLTPKGKDTILGATIVGNQAGELLAEWTLAMKYNLGLNKILGTVHPYPTMSEANKYTAGVWKQANKPERIMALLEKYHRWQRGRSARDEKKTDIADHQANLQEK
ncbi:FAD-dependent oxidoreductase [Photobacterium galatheae]|uniref:Pyridine nucleotide-disulfide oxidoreductase n=1 Tax=Photobacterium galatheae TaxID=1654360 RepID=A0A066RMA6_9GAMM|nr:bifunctional TVP38/TMEM64 family protein/FAD-dependent oxidoreductase [Photobacterium galatheae]KDM91575.1 pyridine nucleotide-disulfide oxidoreductase [Photobacterium galatheae]MCM0149648.1 FAD-dependent oxidoreductase [Photobacterium galatheae]